MGLFCAKEYQKRHLFIWKWQSGVRETKNKYLKLSYNEVKSYSMKPYWDEMKKKHFLLFYSSCLSTSHSRYTASQRQWSINIQQCLDGWLSLHHLYLIVSFFSILFPFSDYVLVYLSGKPRLVLQKKTLHRMSVKRRRKESVFNSPCDLQLRVPVLADLSRWCRQKVGKKKLL